MTIDKRKKLKLSPNGISSKVTANSLMADNVPDNGAYLTYDSNGSILSWHTSSSGSVSHNDTIGIQGGSSNSYYHLTSNDYNLVTGSLNNHLISTGSSVHGLGTISTQSASSVNITGGSVSNANFNYIGMKTTAGSPTYAEGRLYWDNTDHTLALMTEKSNTTLQIGQEAFVRVVNKSGSLLADGTTVFLSGAQGNRPTVYPASASSDLTSRTIGVITADIPNNEEGYVTTLGLVRDFNTSAFDAGSPLYLSTTAGSLTQTRPPAPAHSALVAFSLNSTNNGSIFVNPDVGSDLSTLHDVSITTPAGGNILTYNSSGSYWNNNNTITGSSGSPMLTVTNSGSNTAMFGDSTNNTIFDKNGFIIAGGSGMGWTDLEGSFQTAKQGATDKPPFDPVTLSYLFPQNDATNVMYLTMQFPHTYAPGTDIYPHIHILQTHTGSPIFTLEYMWTNIGELTTGSWVQYTMSTPLAVPYTSGSMHQIMHNTTPVSGSGKKISSIFLAKLYRSNDSYTGVCPAYTFDIHYLSNTPLGSRTSTVK